MSACPAAYFFALTPTNSQAEFPCSQLDGSYLSSGMITANCSSGNTWGPLDMSQCTFRNDVPVAAVAVIEVVSDSATWTRDVSLHLCNYYVHEVAINWRPANHAILYTKN